MKGEKRVKLANTLTKGSKGEIKRVSRATRRTLKDLP